jgi:FAD/FMN-containing dehydrogenase
MVLQKTLTIPRLPTQWLQVFAASAIPDREINFLLQVHPKSTEDVVKIVNIARKYRVPIVPYSGATSLEGHFSGVDAMPSCTT